MTRSRLVLARERLSELTDADLGGVAGGTVTRLTFTCVTAYTVVCLTVGECPVTGYCTYTRLCE